MRKPVFYSTDIILDQILRSAQATTRLSPQSRWHIYADSVDDIRAMNLPANQYEEAIARLCEVVHI